MYHTQMREWPGLHCCRTEKSPNSSSWWLDHFQRFSAGCASGVFATTVNNSLDVIKSRVQQCSPHVPYPCDRAWHKHWTLTNWCYLARTEGLRGLFRGYSAKVLRMGLGGGVVIVSYDMFIDAYS